MQLRSTVIWPSVDYWYGIEHPIPVTEWAKCFDGHMMGCFVWRELELRFVMEPLSGKVDLCLELVWLSLGFDQIWYAALLHTASYIYIFALYYYNKVLLYLEHYPFFKWKHIFIKFYITNLNSDINHHLGFPESFDSPPPFHGSHYQSPSPAASLILSLFLI